MSTCKAINCLKPIRAKSFCEMHYHRIRRHGSIDKLKPHGELIELFSQIFQDKPQNRKEWIMMRDLAFGHPKSITAMHKKRFGGLREKVLERDDNKCTICGMTNEEHLVRWSRNLTIDHIDGYGRNVKNPHNLETNLRTLCLSCHGRVDSRKYWQGRK